MTELSEVFDELEQALDQRDKGDFRGAEEGLRRVARDLDVRAVGELADRLRGDAERSERELTRARELSAQGQLVEARQVLLTLLETWPMHDAARREMEILDEGAKDKEKRLGEARALAAAGRLREASAAVLSLAVPGGQGDEARLLLRDVQQRMDLADTGLRQVLRSIHGRDSATREGLVHCARRIEELQKIQVDHDELNALRGAVEAEVEGLDRTAAADAALTAEDPRALRAAIGELVSVRAKFLGPHRLEARGFELGDRLAKRADADLKAGRLHHARQWVEAFEACAPDDLAGRLAELGDRIDAQAREAEEQTRAATEAIEARDLELAEECLAAARAVWVDSPEVKRIESSLWRVRSQEREIADVEAMAGRRDFDGAQRGIGRMGPTPELLRTRIFDLKKSIAKAQGLDHAFILRVDEGGEFVVVRGDSVTVGNLRDGGSDLPLLANLAGCHARFRRSMSFHGGMQDKIVAERGKVFVGGREVSEARLQHGSRVRLGSSVEFDYLVPSQRSLTALVALRGGFQVAGSDRVLLMKDRGRDGKILIGRAVDAHVRVPGADQEIELFTNKEGQVRVRFAGQGTMDGRPFTGEHPVTAGAVITCGSVSFVLLPWGRS